MVKFSGSDGYHLMWDVPDLASLSDEELWRTERAVVRAVACMVERQLVTDPAADPIRAAVGPGRPLIATGSADRENPQALLFDEYILKENANFRAPFSVHPQTGLVTVPLSHDQLTTFRPEEATPNAVARDWPASSLPEYSLADVQRALQEWGKDGC